VGLTIREACTADIDAVLQLWKRAGAHPSATDTANDLGRVIDAHHAAVLIAVDADGTIVGSLIATFDGWRATCIAWSWTHPYGAAGSRDVSKPKANYSFVTRARCG